jgi:hypothetical protein
MPSGSAKFAANLAAAWAALPPRHRIARLPAASSSKAKGQFEEEKIMDSADGAPEPKGFIPIRVHHGDLHPEDVATVYGILVITTPARTLLDLASTVEPCELEQALVAALARGLTSPVELLEVMTRHLGVPRLAALLDR